MSTVEELFQCAFSKPRDPRSDEYKAGVRAALTYRLEGRHHICPYATLVQQDAYFAGCQEGHAIAREQAA